MPKYKSKPLTVEAVRLSSDMTLGNLRGDAFDWLVTEPDGAQYFLKPAEFEARFELVEGSRKRAVEPEPLNTAVGKSGDFKAKV